MLFLSWRAARSERSNMRKFDAIFLTVKRRTYYTICGFRILIDLAVAVFSVYGFSYFIKTSGSTFLTVACILFLIIAYLVVGLDLYYTIKNIKEIKSTYQSKEKDNKSKIEF